MMFDNYQSQQLDMFGYLSFATGNCTHKALDKEATHVAANIINRDSHNRNTQETTRFGEKQVYKTANTNVLKQCGGNRGNMGDHRARYFTSSSHRYRDGRRSGFIQSCGRVTKGCGSWYTDGKGRGNGVSAISGRETGTLFYSYPAEGGQNRGDGYFTDKLETHISGGYNGSVQNIARNWDSSSCTSDVQDSKSWVCTEGLLRNWSHSRNKNVQNSKGDSCTAILQNRREDRCTTIIQNNREGSCTTSLQNKREDSRTTCVQNNGGERGTICVHSSGADSNVTRAQNNSTVSCTGPTEIKKTENYICTVVERCTSNVQCNEGCNTVIELISARKCTIRGQGNNEDSCKNCSRIIKHNRSNNWHNGSTVNCTSVIETNRAANCANNMGGNLNRDCISSANNDNAENINQHKRGTTNGTTTVIHAERIDTSTSCKQNPDGKGKLGDKEPSICEHTRKPSLSCLVTICKRSTHTSRVEEGTRSISNCRRGTTSSGMCTYTTRKGLIAPPRFSCPQEKSSSDPLAINGSSKLHGAQSVQPMYVARVNYTESAIASPCSRCPRQQSPSAPPAINESSNFKDMQITHPTKAACVGNADQLLEPTADAETHSSSGNCSTHLLLGFQEKAVSACKPQVCSHSKGTEKRHHCQYYNTLANRHIGNLIQPLSNIAIAGIPSSNRRTKLNRDIWPTETNNRTFSNGMREGNRQQVVSKFRTAHEKSHQTTNKEMTPKHSTNPCSHAHSATSGVTQQQRSTRSEKSYLFKRKDILDKSSKYAIPNRHNFRKVPRFRQQNTSAAPPDTTGQTSSCPVIQINSQPADRSPLGFVLGLGDDHTAGTDADTPSTDAANFPTSRSGGYLSVPGPQVYFQFEGPPKLSDQ